MARKRALKLYVISDTHGRTDKALDIYKRLSAVDLIIHLGDMERDARKISESTGKTVISVRGNNESSHQTADFYILETEYGNLFLTHGHLQGVKRDLRRLLYRAQELGCKAALFGHTHTPIFTEVDGIYLLNPGSLTRPAGTSASYAIIHTSKIDFSASIINCSTDLL